MSTIRYSFVLALLVLAASFAQAPATWQTATEFPGLDQTGLSAEQKRTLFTLIRAQSCSCGCTMHVAECRVKDPRCGVSRGLAAMVARELREGKTAEAIRADLERRTKEAPPVLDEAVKIPIEDAPVKGPANARITLVEFSDFQCPYCATAVGHLYELMAKHPADVRLVFKQFPLDTHSQAGLAAEAALAAHAQGKFWPMHDKLYANFRDLSPEKINQWATDAGLDLVRFTMDLKSGKYKAAVQKEVDEGVQAGVQGTPTIFVNGKRYNGPVETAPLEQVLLAELKTVATRAAAPRAASSSAASSPSASSRPTPSPQSR
jgi:protein-disulfide isomerase